jgi:hypothetical protein
MPMKRTTSTWVDAQIWTKKRTSSKETIKRSRFRNRSKGKKESIKEDKKNYAWVALQKTPTRRAPPPSPRCSHPIGGAAVGRRRRPRRRWKRDPLFGRHRDGLLCWFPFDAATITTILGAPKLSHTVDHRHSSTLCWLSTPAMLFMWVHGYQFCLSYYQSQEGTQL